MYLVTFPPLSSVDYGEWFSTQYIGARNWKQCPLVLFNQDSILNRKSTFIQIGSPRKIIESNRESSSEDHEFYIKFHGDPWNSCCDFSLWTKVVDQWIDQHHHQTDWFCWNTLSLYSFIPCFFFFLTLQTPGVILFPPSYFQMPTSSIPPHPSQWWGNPLKMGLHQ